VQGPDTTRATEELAACERCGDRHGRLESCSPSRTLAFGAGPAVEHREAGQHADPLVGTQVGSFRIARLLGRGGMGTVYLAEHPVIGSRVAVKFLHESMASDPDSVARFFDEARAVNLIGHENIVGIFDLSSLSPQRYYFVMEYLEGDTLQAFLRAGPVALPVAREVLLQMCDALQCAHEHGAVHRDLKPENVCLVQRRGKPHFVKLVDFGIAKLRGAGTPSRTQAGFVVGTPEYMAPEQCDEGTVDGRTDVYALGVMAFELATGRLPFQGRSIPQLLLAHLREKPPRPSDLAQVEPGFERAILRALEKDPASRFPDMASFAEALRAVPPGWASKGAPAPAAAPLEAARSPAAAPAPLAGLTVEIAVAGAPPATVPPVDLTRAGLFLLAEKDLPPLRSRVRLSLAHPSLRAKLALDGEVIQHVTPAEAASWRMAPGFAVQFLDPAPEARAAVAALADELRRDTPAPAPPPSAEALEARLRALETRAEGHYALLGLPPDAEFSDVRRALAAVRAELEAACARPLAADHPSRAMALLARADAAQEALGSPAARLAHDARRGNHVGVARCLAAGVPAALAEARRREILLAEPERAAEAKRQLALAEVARKLGNVDGAARAFEAALRADPLDARAREAYAAFRSSTPG